MIMYFAFYASSPEPLILATTFFINSSLNLYLFLYTMYARMTPIVGTIHISTRIEFCVASDCTAFGTYPVSSSTNPIASEVNAAVSFTISVCKENTLLHFSFQEHTHHNQQHLQGIQSHIQVPDQFLS